MSLYTEIAKNTTNEQCRVLNTYVDDLVNLGSQDFELLCEYFLDVDLNFDKDGNLILGRWQVTCGGPTMEYRFDKYRGYYAFYSSGSDSYEQSLDFIRDNEVINILEQFIDAY